MLSKQYDENDLIHDTDQDKVDSHSTCDEQSPSISNVESSKATTDRKFLT